MRLPPSRLRFATALALLCAVASCSSPAEHATAVPFDGGPMAGKPERPLAITSTDPSFGQPGEVQKQVRVLGSGFGSDAQVAWERNGAADPKITVHATTVVSSTEILATITIADDATLDLYDVAVTTLGKKGVGTEVFEVTRLLNSECGGKTELLDSRARLQWEDLEVRGDGSPYERQGSVHVKIFYHDSNCSRSGDLVFDPDGNGGTTPRAMRFHFPPNDAGVPTGEVSAAPAINFRSLMQIGSDLNGDGVANARDAKIEAKFGLVPRSLEVPSNVQYRPDYPAYPTGPATPIRFSNMGLRGCEALEFDLIRLTRHTGAFVAVNAVSAFDGLPLGEWSAAPADLGTWTVESAETVRNGVSGHWAQCYVTKKGTLVQNGSPMQMRFRVSITEQRP